MGMKEQIMRFRSFWVFPLLAIIVLALTKRLDPDIEVTELVWLVPIGLFAWTLLEYGLHRFAFHLERHDTWLLRVLTASHNAHHSAPRDPDKVFVHTTFGLVVSLLLYTLLYISSGSVFRAAGLMTGIWMGFLYYEY